MTVIQQEWMSNALFSGLPPDCVERLSHTTRNESFESRELIFREGEPADGFHLIQKGSVALEIFVEGRGAVMIETLGPGEVLGWSWLVEPYRWHFDAKALTATQTIVFGGRVVREVFESHRDCGYLMLKRFLPIIVQRLQATRLQFLDVYHARA